MLTHNYRAKVRLEFWSELLKVQEFLLASGTELS